MHLPCDLHKNIKPKLVATSNNRTAIAIPAILAPVQKPLLLPAVATTGAFAGTTTVGGDCLPEARGVGESKGGGSNRVNGDGGGGTNGDVGGGTNGGGGGAGSVLN
jgi:uncharacterized membrane protein YgcG